VFPARHHIPQPAVLFQQHCFSSLSTKHQLPWRVKGYHGWALPSEEQFTGAPLSLATKNELCLQRPGRHETLNQRQLALSGQQLDVVLLLEGWSHLLESMVHNNVVFSEIMNY